jgi:hypothetical protein
MTAVAGTGANYDLAKLQKKGWTSLGIPLTPGRRVAVYQVGTSVYKPTRNREGGGLLVLQDDHAENFIARGWKIHGTSIRLQAFTANGWRLTLSPNGALTGGLDGSAVPGSVTAGMFTGCA